MTKETVLAACALACAAAMAAGEVTVRTAKPDRVEESDPVSLVGRVSGSRSVSLSARVVGTLWEQIGDEGTDVRKGDVLYRIEDTVYRANLQTAKAKEAELAAQLALAEVEAERYAKSESGGGVSKSERDKAVLRRDVAKAELDAAKAQVVLAQNDLDYCTISSPLDGRLGANRVDPGNNVGPDFGTLRDVIAYDPIDVKIAVPEPKLIWAFENRQAKRSTRIRLQRADGRDFPIALRVAAVDNKVDSSTGTVQVRLRGANPDCALMPGGYVKVLLSQVYAEPKIAVPTAAVAFEGAQCFVYVVKDGRAAKREVKLECANGDRMIVASGLAPDEDVVVAGVHKLRDGAAVSVKER